MSTTPQQTIAQRLEAFTKRWRPANSRRERLIALRDTEASRLAELKAQALEKFGTDDLDKLREQYQAAEQANEKILFEAELELDEVERALTEVEQKVNF